MTKNYPVFRFWILFLVVFKLFTIGAAHAQYLEPKNMRDYGTHDISHVSFGTINNSSFRTDGGYKHYSSVAATDLHAGETINGIISITIAGSNQNKNTVAVWVNFSENSDDDFEDAGERFLFTIQHNSYVPGNKVLNVPISIPIPATVPAGPSRIRVGFRSGIETNFTSIDYNWGAGEVEDYNINIISDAPVPGDDQYEANYCLPEYINND